MIDKERLNTIEQRIYDTRNLKKNNLDQAEEDREYLFKVLLEIIKDSAVEIMDKLSVS